MEADTRLRPPARKVHGDGEPYKVWANHFVIQSLPRLQLYMYDIRVTAAGKKEGSSEEVKQCPPAMIGRILQTPQAKEILGDGFVFDGVSIGWATKKLPIEGDTATFGLEIPGARPGRAFGCTIGVQYDGPFTCDALTNWVLREQQKGITIEALANYEQDQEVLLCLKFINSLLRKDCTERFVSGQGNKSTTFFDKSRDGNTSLTLSSTQGVIEAWRGFYQTASARFGQITVNVDTATATFIKPGINFIDAISRFSGVQPEDLERGFDGNRERIMEAAKKFSGVGFKVKHIKGPKGEISRRGFRLTRLSAEEDTFQIRNWNTDDEGNKTFTLEEISIAEYYSRQYNIKLRYPKLPTVETRKGDKYPLELCFVDDAERWKELLQGGETAEFIKFAAAPAFARRSQIEESLKKIGWHNMKPLEEFGVSIKPQFIELEAKILPSPVVVFGQGTENSGPRNGRWNLRGKRFYKPGTINGYGLLYIPGGHGMRVDERGIDTFTKTCGQQFSHYGVSTNPRCSPQWAMANPQGDFERQIHELISKLQTRNGLRPNLLIFILPSVAVEPYCTIKKICDTTFGIASQCMVLEKCFNPKGQLQYLANIALKVNVKLGGSNMVIDDPFLMKQPTMIMGCDASHPNPAQRRMDPPPPTFTAISASYDRRCAKYSAVTSCQPAGQEMIQDFGAMTQELLKRFQEQAKRDPSAIIYFRDGLSESELDKVVRSELAELKKVTKAKISVIVCVKRHHTRFFPLDKGDKNGNIAVGTVVENGHGKDIFMVSHAGLQGTVRPTHYMMLHDENNLTAVDFQRICNNVCYAYGRATVSVSIAPPVYYANLACDRARSHVVHTNQGQSELLQVHDLLKYSMWWQ
ncbi:unnamed protein product [Tuber melanosporum]|uniref:(Perigord truffle) hypothetical protein n=1 Tax=Tuber melanosporum (strain Mel28) TaxID=656061 RepID=D5GML0_TUBMM|nr:uncharacterized protein GSTUM_00010783001 [Tuber melanosporum]CAZ85753.1 unnamed protein product [Tuber melanosporum]